MLFIVQFFFRHVHLLRFRFIEIKILFYFILICDTSFTCTDWRQINNRKINHVNILLLLFWALPRTTTIWLWTDANVYIYMYIILSITKSTSLIGIQKGGRRRSYISLFWLFSPILAFQSFLISNWLDKLGLNYVTFLMGTILFFSVYSTKGGPSKLFVW
jgi:hypothetical protein